MATQAEIEAAEREYERVYDEMDGGSGRHKRALIAALEAAEQVRPRRDPTNATRVHEHRARKRAERNVAAQ